VDTCRYSAKSIYVKNDKFPWYSWDCIDKHYDDISREEKTESLKTFNKHGECAFKTGSDLIDHQTVSLQFSNGSTATHNLLQGTVFARRLIRVVGTLGEIEGSIDSSQFKVYKYDFDKAWYVTEEYDVLKDIAEGDHHAGGDEGIIADFVSMVRGGEVSVSCTKIQDSIYGHLCVYKADEAMEKCAVQDILYKE
jgi:predicted dehydrogenase